MRILLVVLLTAACAFAQKVASVRAGMVYHTEKAILVDGVAVNPRGLARLPQIEDGQTAAAPDGHAEILMGPGAVLWMRAGSRIRFDDTRLTVGHVTLLEGSLVIEIKQKERDRLITVTVGEAEYGISEEGVFRFDAAASRARVFAGELLVAKTAEVLTRGSQASTLGVEAFERTVRDEFHYWAAYRSMVLEKESGREQRWKMSDDELGGSAKHDGFGVSYPWNESAAHIKYLAAGEAGLIYAMTGEIKLSSRVASGEARLPLPIGEGNSVTAAGGQVEIFLGVGVVVRLNRGATLRVLDSRAWAPAVRLESGSATIEVGTADEAPQPRVEVGESVSELRKRGVYEFDAARGTLWVYDGESETVFPKRTLRAKGGEAVNLNASGAVAKFDMQRKDALLEWSGIRSFELFAKRAGFMTNWKAGVNADATHKVFGSRRDSRIPRAPRAASTIDMRQGPTDAEREDQRRQDDQRRQQQQQQQQQQQ